MKKDYIDAEFYDMPGGSSTGAAMALPYMAKKAPFMSYGNTGLNVMGKNIGKGSIIANGLYQGYNAAKGLNKLSNGRDNQNTIKSKILSTAAANPMNSSYLSADNMRLLRQLRNGTYDSSNSASGMGILSGALKGAGTGILGGPLGMLLGGIGGAITGGIDSKANSVEAENEKLEALLAELEDAQTQYNQLKRPNFNQMGLQSRYTNQWM